MAELPCRAEHVGSLLRPKELTTAFRAHGAGTLDDDAFREIQDRAIRDVVRLQQEAGLRMVTDGEFRRGSYWGHFIGPVAGLTVRDAVFSFRDDQGVEQAFIAPHVAGKVRRTRPISNAEFRFLADCSTVTPKITLPSPPTFHFWRGGAAIDPDAYENANAFFDDFAKIYQQEIKELHELGARYIQIDEVPLAMLCDDGVRAKVAAWGDDPDRLMDLYIGAINQAVAGRPAGMTVAMHICRGNFKGKYLSEGGYEPVAERLFQGIQVDAFFLEYDTPRAGDFAPLRFVPAPKRVVLGLVSSKRPALEDGDDLVRRIEAAARVIDGDRLSLSPQCGFASAVSGNPVTLDDERAKLDLIVRTAIRVWGQA